MKWICAIFSLALFTSFYSIAHANEQNGDGSERSKPTFYQEVECSRDGGICIHETDCPTGKLSQFGSCPNQRSTGAVCCHSPVPVSETSCQKLGGICTPTCSVHLVALAAADCPKEEMCCPLTV